MAFHPAVLHVLAASDKRVQKQQPGLFVINRKAAQQMCYIVSIVSFVFTTVPLELRTRKIYVNSAVR